MLSSSNLRHKIMVLLLAIALIRGLIYMAVTPPWQAPDEFRHFEYIKLLHLKRRLLTNQDNSPALQREIIASMIKHNYWKFGRFSFPFNPKQPPESFSEIIWPTDAYWLFQPPSYYLLGSVLIAFIGPEDIDLQLYLVRGMSVIFGLIVVFITYLVATELFPADDFVVVGAPAFVAFLPMHTFITSSANNDSLAELVVSLIILALTLSFKYGVSGQRIIAIGGLVVLALLTKRTAIVTVPIAMVSVVIYLWGQNWREFLRRGKIGVILGAVAVSTASLAAFWWQRLGLSSDVVDKVRPYLILIPGANYSQLFTVDGIALLSYYAITLFESFWARFGWMNVFLAPKWYYAIALISAMAVVGAVMFFLQNMGRESTLMSWQKQCLILFLVTVIFVVSVTMFYGIRVWAHFQGYDSGINSVPPQGRYLFVALVPISILFMLGLGQVFPGRYRLRWFLICLSWFVFLDMMALIQYIIPFYYG